MAPMLCAHLVDFPARLHRVEFIQTSPVIIDELLTRFRRSYPELTGCARKRAMSLLCALNFRKLVYIPTHLRFFAKEFPILCVEKTDLFRQDEEIIRLLMSVEQVGSLREILANGRPH